MSIEGLKNVDVLNGKIRIYNYEKSPVGFYSQHKEEGIFIKGRDEDEEYVIDRVHFDDIEIENSKSDLFKAGRLRFHPEEENEIYTRLGIEDRENIMSDKDLIDFLSKDSIENIKRIAKIKSNTLITRMKNALYSMERSNNPAPQRIIASIMERNEEIKYGTNKKGVSQIGRMLAEESKVNEDAKLKETLQMLAEKVEKLEQENNSKDAQLKESETSLQFLINQVKDLMSAKEVTETKAEEQPKTNAKTTNTRTNSKTNK